MRRGRRATTTADGEQEELILDSSCADIGQARRATEDYLVRACAWVDLGSVLLVVSELVTNAHRHAAGRWRLRVLAEPRLVRVEVADHDPVPPSWRSGNLDGSGGWGLRIAEGCADSLEVLPAASGKTVRAQWLHPDRTGAAAA